jgi:glutaredoxin-related protein
MIKIYGMKSCPDCQWVDAQVEHDDRFQVIDIGEHVSYLKAFLRLRDNSPVFDEARANGYAGIPCFVLEDGTVTLSPEDVGLSAAPEDGATCRLDGSGC